MRDQVFRELMAAVCAPVTVVTSADEAGPHGATVSAFASLSLRPPLTVALDRRSALLASILGTRRLGVNVLAAYAR
jgi:flavin reductase (DIM6/NTAB) family NADH-FMN oxidoreductase RutF